MNTDWHFPIMIIASLLIFLLIMRIVLGGNDFTANRLKIFLLAMVVVVLGMLFGKYGAISGVPWWIYYPVPMLLTVLLPPILLQLNFKKTLVYLVLSFLSAPFIHAFFSFFFGWTEYMPFWRIPHLGDL